MHMAHHKDFHPQAVEGCFGCKGLSIGYDGKHLTKSITDENNATTVQHRSGRQDVTVRPKRIKIKTMVEED